MASRMLRFSRAASAQSRKLSTASVKVDMDTSGPMGVHRSVLPPGYALDSRLLVTNPVQASVLDNGFKVVSKKQQGEMCAVGVFIDAGSRDEAAEKNGVAHFLEHLMFKGTSKRSQSDIESEIERKGAHLNAYTSREHTCYVARVLKQDLPWAVEFLQDILCNSVYAKESMEVERSVILREMEEVNKDLKEFILDNLHTTAFHNQALGRTILGPTEIIQTLQPDDVNTFVKANYTGPRMNMVVVGDVDHAQVQDLGAKNFGDVSASPRAQLVGREPARYIGSDIRVRDDDQENVHFAVGFESFGLKSADSVSLMMMNTILGSWTSSSQIGDCGSATLGQKVSEYGLGSEVSAFNTQFSDTGLFGVYGVGKPDNISDLIWCVQREMLNLAHTVSDEQAEWARTQLKANLLASSEGSGATCEDIGRQLVGYGRTVSIAEMFARIDAVDATAIRRVANDIINDRDHVCAAYGPLAGMPDYTWMRRRTYMLRY